MTGKVDLEKQKIKNLKICAAALTAISGGCALVPNPIFSGISIAAGLGAVLTEYYAKCLDAEEAYHDSLVNVVPVR